MQNYLVYREVKPKHAGTLRNILVFVQAKSVSDAVKTGRSLMRNEPEYMAIRAVLLNPEVPFFI